MPRYFFDIDDGERKVTDPDGTVLPDRMAARDEAIAILPDLAREQLPDGDQRTFICRVREEDGKVIFEAQLALTTSWLDGIDPRA